MISHRITMKDHYDGDDKLAEYVKEFKDADVTLTVTELPLQAAKTMFGHEISEADKSVTYADRR